MEKPLKQTGNNFVELTPVENPLILKKIFDLLTFEELQTCRVVSKLWYDGSLASWRNLVKVEIWRLERRFKHFHETFKPDNYLDRPFVNSYIIGPNNSKKNTKRFWRMWGSTIDKLKLTNITFRSVDQFNNVIFKCCPVLTELTLSSCTVKDDRSEPEIDTYIEPKFGEKKSLKFLKISEFRKNGFSWMEFLSHFPCLKILILEYNVTNKYELLKAINIIRTHDPRKLHLTEFHTSLNGSKDIVSSIEMVQKIILDSDLKLKTFGISHHLIPSCCESILTNMLKTHSVSLQNVSLDQGITRFSDLHVWFTFTNQIDLPKLRECSVSGHQFSFLRFLDFAPNIDKLVLSNIMPIYETDRQLQIMTNIKLNNCRKLEVVNSRFGPKEYQILVSLLPNVIDVTLKRMNWNWKGQFAFICEHWPMINLLRIYNALLCDCEITGLDHDDIEQINKEGSSSSWRPITVPRANISTLRHLTHFELDGGRHGSTWRGFGCCAAICGIQQVSRLKSLRIKNYKLEDAEFWSTIQDKYPY